MKFYFAPVQNNLYGSKLGWTNNKFSALNFVFHVQYILDWSKPIWIGPKNFGLVGNNLDLSESIWTCPNQFGLLHINLERSKKQFGLVQNHFGPTEGQGLTLLESSRDCNYWNCFSFFLSSAWFPARRLWIRVHSKFEILLSHYLATTKVEMRKDIHLQMWSFFYLMWKRFCHLDTMDLAEWCHGRVFNYIMWYIYLKTLAWHHSKMRNKYSKFDILLQLEHQ